MVVQSSAGLTEDLTSGFGGNIAHLVKCLTQLKGDC